MPRNALILIALLLLLLSLTACSSATGEGSATANILPPAPAATAVTKMQATVEEPATVTAVALSYPVPPAEKRPTLSADSTPQGDSAPSAPASAGSNVHSSDFAVFLPYLGGFASGIPTATPALPPPIDFEAVSAELEAEGQELAFVKTGFHVTLPEDRAILDDWMARLDEAGVPFFLKTVDNAEPLYRAQELMRKSGVPHVLVYRSTGDVPHYELPPKQAAQHHWSTHRDLFPPELDPSLVWVETLNEPDRTQSEWLAQFATETAKLAMADGFRWAAFGWASGEPEPDQWRGPAMLEFLRFAGENPDKVAVALHEYSYLSQEIEHEYPYKVGRFQTLFEIVDTLGIPRPTVLITEWGWEYANIPPIEEALRDIDWASELYANYPQVRGAAIWNIGSGCCYGDISEQVQKLIGPLTEFSLAHYYAAPREWQPVNKARFQP